MVLSASQFERAWFEARKDLRETGIALLRDVFPLDVLTSLREAAARAFAEIEASVTPPQAYGYLPSAHSFSITALREFGVNGNPELPGLPDLDGFAAMCVDELGGDWAFRPEQCWVRKKFAPHRASPTGYHIQDWHQDGALGVCFPAKRGDRIAMTKLLTYWIPLNDCGADSPGLEFVRGRQAELLHFTELCDSNLRRIFKPESFWSPVLCVGDGLVFSNSVLHRTFVLPGMTRDRLSIEYRVFAS